MSGGVRGRGLITPSYSICQKQAVGRNDYEEDSDLRKGRHRQVDDYSGALPRFPRKFPTWRGIRANVKLSQHEGSEVFMGMEQAHCLNVNENQCGMCMPLGAILALKGVEGAMVIIHGSQGCSTYMRRHIAEHFNEPIDVASSSLNEKGTIYGGEASLKKGLDNSIKLYNPKMVGILTTCLAKTIGEDIDRIAADYLEERGLKELPVVTVSTPGYGYGHFEGYFLAVKRIVAELAKKTVKHKGINVIVPNLSPADIREIKRILKMMKASYILLPDFSDTLDRAFERPYRKVPAEGTKLSDIAGMAGAVK